MGKLTGIIPIEGTVGGITFVKTGDGTVAKEKSTLSKQRIDTDPAFENTRSNNKEFSLASASGKLLRDAFHNTCLVTPDSKWVARLSKRMVKLIRTDMVHGRGLRTVQQGKKSILAGYEWNERAPLHRHLFDMPEVQADPLTGACSATYTEFFPGSTIDPPKGTSHFKIILAAAAVDFEHMRSTAFAAESEMIPYIHEQRTPPDLRLTVPTAAGQTLLVALGLEYYEWMRRAYCPVNKGKQNALCLMKALEM